MTTSTNKTGNARKVENLIPHQFKPGESGNPAGRPKRLPVTDFITEQLEKPIPATMRAQLPALFTEVYGENATFGQMLAYKVIAQAAKGDIQAMNTVLDRVEGKVRQNVGVSGENSGPVEFRLTRVVVDL